MKKLIIALTLLAGVCQAGITNNSVGVVYDTGTNIMSLVDGTLGIARVQLDVSEASGWSAGQTSYDTVTKTILADTGYADVRVNVGQETHIRFFNDTGVTITNGYVINASGSTNNVLKGFLADSSSPATSSVIIGLATHDVPDGTIGVATAFGEVRDIDTSAVTPNGPVYASTNGLFTSTRPVYPANIVVIGSAISSHATEGIMQVKLSPFTRQTVVNNSPFSSSGTGSGSQFIAGSYNWDSDDVTLTQASTNDTIGTVGVATDAHAGICCAGGATVDGGGTVGLLVYGTSSVDDGTITLDDFEVITTNIVSLTTDQYLETTKNWVGQPEYQTYVTSGSPTSYSVTFNRGFSAYVDAANQNFSIISIRTEGVAGQNDTDFNVRLYHHKPSGWTYAATGFVAGNGVIADFETTYGVLYSNIAAGENFKFKVTNLNTFIAGAGDEGYLIEVTTSNNNSIQFSNTTISGALETF